MTTGQRIARGIRWGVWAAAAYAAYAIMLFLARGSQPFERIGVSLGSTLAIYVCGGLGAGVIVSLLASTVHSRAGSSLVGVVASLPAAVGTYVILPDSEYLGEAVAVTAVLVGAGMGALLWRPSGRRAL